MTITHVTFADVLTWLVLWSVLALIAGLIYGFALNRLERHYTIHRPLTDEEVSARTRPNGNVPSVSVQDWDWKLEERP